MARRLPCTKLPTITEAGPTEVSVTDPDELPVVEGGGGGRAPICFVSSKDFIASRRECGAGVVLWLVRS